MRGRASGILLHPTSLPGRHGIGDLGDEAMHFVDLLADSGVAVWQLLPITAPGAYGSPYDCRSAFAGNWLLISPERLAADGVLDLPPGQAPLPGGRLSLPEATAHKGALMRAGWRQFRDPARSLDRGPFLEFRHSEAVRHWLDDWSLFAALDRRFEHRPWTEWPAGLRDRRPAALENARSELGDEIDFQAWLQFHVHRQLASLRDRARRRGVRLCGDLPIYPAHHSADVWAHPHLFHLAPDGRPESAAGVPPDAFSDTGQLWGNPTYRWAAHRADGYSWWVERLRAQAATFDMLRLDHFRGFVAYWRVPLPASDATGGRWIPGPGRALFQAFERGMRNSKALELIAEDLGHITAPVQRLRDELGLPGMRVAQFGFDEPESDHRPDRCGVHCVVYTGTHDNDTLLGWLSDLPTDRLRRVTAALGLEADADLARVARRLVRAVLDSDAALAILPAQDVLGLGSAARMNTPGTIYDNWSWRLGDGDFGGDVRERLARWVRDSRRQSPGNSR